MVERNNELEWNGKGWSDGKEHAVVVRERKALAGRNRDAHLCSPSTESHPHRFSQYDITGHQKVPLGGFYFTSAHHFVQLYPSLDPHLSVDPRPRPPPQSPAAMSVLLPFGLLCSYVRSDSPVPVINKPANYLLIFVPHCSIINSCSV